MYAIGDPARIVFPEKAERALVGAGLPLRQLLDLYITGDRNIQAMLRHANGHYFNDWSSMTDRVQYDCDTTAMQSGQFLHHQPFWPACLSEYDLFVEWCNRSGSRFPNKDRFQRQGLLDNLEDYNPSSEDLLYDLRGIAKTVRDRFEAMMVLLRSGDVRAFGHMANGSALSEISVSIWQSTDTRIDFIKNRVFEIEELDQSYQSGKPIVEKITNSWTGVVLRWPENRPLAGLTAPKDKGGREPVYLWETAYDMLVLEVGNNGFPGSGKKSDLAGMLLACFVEMKAKVPSLGAAEDWLRDNHRIVWEGSKAPVRKPPRKSPAK